VEKRDREKSDRQARQGKTEKKKTDVMAESRREIDRERD
jgi:hypothetical protein